MKFTHRSMFALAAIAMLSATPAMADAPAATPAKEAQLSEFAPFGVTQNSDLETLGCTVFEDDLYDCKGLPEKNAMFGAYTVETRSGPRDGICNVTAYSQVFRGDRTGWQVTKAYEKLAVLLGRKYGPATSEKNSNAAGNSVGYQSADQFAAAVKAGVKQFSKEWTNSPAVLPHGTSITMKMVATSDEKTFVELNYFFGGPGCSTEEDQALRGL